MKQTILRNVTGIIILAVGAGALLDALNVTAFWGLFGTWWPVLVILAGIFTAAGDFRRNYIWALVLGVVGTLLLLRNLDVVSFNVFGLIFPIILIAVGLSVLVSTTRRHKTPTTTHATDDVSVIFSGSETVNAAKDYQGGRVTAIFGGAVLDLRDATIKKEATLDITALFGGVEIRVPREWRVVSKITPIAGGVENKAQGKDEHDGPVLVLTGMVALGGVEVK
ncbi:hypothetical protein KI440_03330 [Candidatus Saccharibacteria bacterium TM7i]|nr:hypothetical protein KI440_03330 [Candidatus Saccharibacteria bacterium TM7i]